MTSKRYVQSYDPEKTGIIPNYYNQVLNVQKRKSKAEELGREKQKKLIRELNIETFDDNYVFSDDASNCSNKTTKSGDTANVDHMTFFKKSNLLRDNKMHEKKILNPSANNESNNSNNKWKKHLGNNLVI